MTLRKKAIVIVALTLVLSAGILYAISMLTLLRGFADLEEWHIREDVQRVTSALSNEISALDSLNVDWASWDDTYAFIEDAGAEYIESNLVAGTFIEMGLNIMVFADSAGDIVFSRAFDLLDEEEMPVPQGLREHLTPGGLLLHHSDIESGAAGIVLLPKGPMLITSRPILTSEDEGPIRGALVMGRYLDDAELQRLAATLRLSITVLPLNDLNASSDFQSVYSSLSGGSSIIVQPLSEEIVAGYTILNDIYGEPVLMLSVETSRDIYQQGQHSMGYYLLSLIIFGIVFGVIVILILERSVISRLAQLAARVSSIGGRGDLSQRVTVIGKDELSSLEADINRMLESLQELYEKERKEREELIEEGKARAQFIHILAHELRTPLTPLMTSTEMLKDLLASEKKMRQCNKLADAALSSVKTLASRLDDLLDIARYTVGAFTIECQSMDIKVLLEEVASRFGAMVEENKQLLNVNVPPDLPPINADPNRLEQVIVNLLSNAVKFSPAGGCIELKARIDNGKLLVSVSDQGSGLSPEEQERIFKPYHRVEQDRQRLPGLGLGLAIAKQIIEAHGGKIYVESQRG